ncbi:MAG: hypothetical protein F8N37_10500 [Telmatospirillum sp.]|nr:hypothetical protein [Telmatospirillum sp.]
MASAATISCFDVAYWFIDRALDDNEYLQPQKLHRLMYLSQAYFAVASQGRLLMPGLFVADEFGPVEPNVFRACAIQRPPIEALPLGEGVIHFLDSIWGRFGQYTAEQLNRQIRMHPPYAEAIAKGKGAVISLAAMVAFYGRKPAETKEEVAEQARSVAAPSLDQVVRPRVMRSQSGAPVAVKKWMPPAKN